MLLHLIDKYNIDLAPDVPKNKGKKAYHKAMYDWLIQDITHIEMFINQEPLRFYDHILDKNGKVISCKVKPDKL